MNIVTVFEQFPTQDDCIKHLESVRWPKGAICTYCKSDNVTRVEKEKRHHCNNCNTSFSVTVGTIFHHTHLPLQKWFLAVSLILNAKKGISSRQLSRDLHVHKDTAWRISMKIREAMRDSWQRELLSGVVEMDETYIGGKPRKGVDDGTQHRGRGTKKTPVVGLISRNGKVKAKAIKKDQINSKTLLSLVRKSVDIQNTTLITDQARYYCRASMFINHKSINHAVTYCVGDVHTNNIESFWAVLKRGIIGQFHKVSLRYLNRYIDEFVYRFNNRKVDSIFDLTIQRGLGV